MNKMAGQDRPFCTFKNVYIVRSRKIKIGFSFYYTKKREKNYMKNPSPCERMFAFFRCFYVNSVGKSVDLEFSVWYNKSRLIDTCFFVFLEVVRGENDRVCSCFYC